MLLTLWTAGYVELDPPPPRPGQESAAGEAESQPAAGAGTADAEESEGYRPRFARPTPDLQKLLLLRAVHPLYGVFLANQLGIADRNERIQALESVLEMPPAVAYHLHVPGHDELPPGPLATTRLDIHLLQRGLVTPEQLGVSEPEQRDGPRAFYDEEPVFVLTLADKLRMWFDSDFPGVHDLRTRPVWCAGELLQFGGHFNKFITAKQLQKQEGVIFRHLLRLILLIGEFAQLTPPDLDAKLWRDDLDDLAARLTDTCRRVDPASTDKVLEEVSAVTVEM